jgi:hypothetical protein
MWSTVAGYAGTIHLNRVVVQLDRLADRPKPWPDRREVLIGLISFI